MLITMLGTTIATNGHTLAEGQSVEVGDEFGQHLIDSGIAETSTEPITRSGKGREVEPPAEPAEEPETRRRAGATGESARQTLTGRNQ